MRNSKRNGFIKSLTAVIAVVLMLALMLTGCTDKDAQSLANKAQSAADKAQTDANTANNNANGAQQDATNALAGLEDLKATVDTLPTDEAVAAAILETLNKYVKGEEGKLENESIITYDELVKFLESAEMTSLLGKYATVVLVEEKITGVNTSVSNLDAKVTETLKGYYTKAEADALKTELNAAIKAAADKAAKNTEDLGKVDARVKALETWVEGAKTSLLTKDEFNTFKTSAEATIATLATKTELNNAVAELNKALLDYAKKTELTDLNTTLNTAIENVQTAIDDHKAAYTAKMADIDAWMTATNTKLGQIDVNAGNITANANEILALKDRVVALETSKTALESAVAELENDLAELEGKVTEEVEAKLAELEKKFGANDDELKKLIGEANEKISALNKSANELKATVEANRKDLDDKINYVLGEIQKLAEKLDEAHKGELDAFQDATVYIAANDYKFDNLLAEYAAKESQYNVDVYAAIVKSINEKRIEFRRALTADAAKEIIETLTGASAAEQTLAQALYSAIQSVYRVDGYLVIGAYAEKNGAMVLTDAKTSVADVETCEAILAQAVAQLSAEDYAKYINMYDPGEGDYVNLQTTVEGFRATITTLEAIEDKAVADIHPAIIAIKGSATEDYFANAFADIKLDMLTERALLEGQVNAATTLIQQFKDANFTDAKDVNIARLIGSQDRIEAANERLTTIKALIAEAEALSDGIDTFLAEKVIEGTNFYYYYDLEALKAHFADPITVFVNANFVATDDAAVIDDFIASYNDLVDAIEYAEYIKTTYADTAADLIVAMDEFIALNNVYSEENYAKYKAVVSAYSKWLFSGKFGNWVDTANHDYILGAERLAKYSAACEAMTALHDAALAVESINEKIAELVKVMNANELNIYSMTEAIRPLRNEIVAWMNNGGIAAPEVTEENAVLVEWIIKTLATEDEFDTVQYAVKSAYVAENWALLDSADFITVINAYNALVKVIVDAAYAEGGVIELIDAINTEDAFMLYQKAAIAAARSEYNAWVAKYNVGVADFNKFDLGENYADARDLIIEHAQKLVAAEHSYDSTLVAAQKDYEKLEADLTAALKDDYKVGIMAAKIPASKKAVDAWVAKYTDKRGFNDVIDAIEGILTEEEYNAITTKNTEYETLVAAAIADYSAFKARLDKYEVGKYNVYMGSDLQTITFGNTLMTWAMNVTGTMNKYGVSGEAVAGALLETFKSDDMDDRFNTDVEGGINMIKVLEKVSIVLGSAEVDGSFLNYIAGLEAEANAIVAAYEAMFTESYVYTIYSRKDIAGIRKAYDEWCVKAGMTNTLSAYEVAGMTACKGYKDLLTDIIDSENKIAALEKEKADETEALNKLIAGLDAIGGADKVTTLNAEQIKAAYAAWETWVWGADIEDVLAMPIPLPNPVYAISGNPSEQPIEAYNVTKENIDKLDAYYDALLAIEALADAVEDAIKDFEDGVTEDELKDAKDALEDLKEANGGKINGAVSAETVAAIAEAEMQVTLAKALAAVDAITGLDAKAAPEQTDKYANYVEWLKAELTVACNEAIADMLANKKVEAEFNGGNDNTYQALADQLNGLYAEYLAAAEAAAKA